ncbi:helix-turn-helix domain-containing protein [Dyadobacter sp. 676]|uniref:Helix-turn-helix domain-containing protein n=1 Tax=Dyadobacter sp. 676 TaxID=3088362 RepID=A0AAU8FJU0_9BACT
MKNKTPDSGIHNPNTNPTTQDTLPAKMRSDPAASSDHLVDVREAKRLLKRVTAKKLYYHCAKGHLPFVRQSGKLYFSETVLRHWFRRSEYQKDHKINR